MLSLTEEIEDIIYRIIGCAIAVHTEFGPGLLELIYQECLVLELVKQVITYLKLANKPAGLLINFNTPSLRAAGIRRVTHPTLYSKN